MSCYTLTSAQRKMVLQLYTELQVCRSYTWFQKNITSLKPVKLHCWKFLKVSLLIYPTFMMYRFLISLFSATTLLGLLTLHLQVLCEHARSNGHGHQLLEKKLACIWDVHLPPKSATISMSITRQLLYTHHIVCNWYAQQLNVQVTPYQFCITY